MRQPCTSLWCGQWEGLEALQEVKEPLPFDVCEHWRRLKGGVVRRYEDGHACHESTCADGETLVLASRILRKPSVSGGIGWKEEGERVLMDIEGELVEDPFEMGDHIHVPLFEGVQHRHQHTTGVGPGI